MKGFAKELHQRLLKKSDKRAVELLELVIQQHALTLRALLVHAEEALLKIKQKDSEEESYFNKQAITIMEANIEGATWQREQSQWIPVSEAARKLRVSLYSIQGYIENQNRAMEYQLKGLWNDISDVVTELDGIALSQSQKHEYISVEALKGWIKKEDAKLEFAGIVRIDELLKFIEQ